ncbi:leucine-rich repeat domain-containing protein, partial [Nanoarchaeota archaeon]
MTTTTPYQDMESLYSHIRDNPKDNKAWLVLADYLTDKNDPRGELLTLDCQLEDPSLVNGDKDVIKRRRDELYEKIGSAFKEEFPGIAVPETQYKGYFPQEIIMQRGLDDLADFNRSSYAPFVQGITLNEDNYKEVISSPEITGYRHITVGVFKLDRILDISVFAESSHLAQLTKLQLYGSDVQDITPLQHLTQLTKLQLYGSDVQDITPLQHLTQLQTLDLHKTGVRDITQLQHLTQLQELHLTLTGVQDITPLQHLTQLQTLHLGETGVQDITPLQHLTQLTTLYLHNTGVQDITPLQHLTQLQELYLTLTGVQDITPLQHLTQL